MIELNWVGFVLAITVYLPYVFYILFGSRKQRKQNKHKQIRIVEQISLYGTLFFGCITLEGVGYTLGNMPLEITWICCFTICILFYYFCWLRYFLKGRNEEDLYTKVILPYPIGISQCAVFVITSILLFHPIVLGFSLVYSISHIYLGLRRSV